MKVLLGMSGGLDSAYSAGKLIEEGHSVEGAVLIMHDYTDLDSARMAAREIGIPLHDGRKRLYDIINVLIGRIVRY